MDSKDFYVSNGGLACGAVIGYSHSYHDSRLDLELSLREPVILPPVKKPLMKTSYQKYLEFPSPVISCLDLLELQAEKIRASYQRLRSRDVYDLSLLAGQPFDKELLRLLVVLKFWHVRGEFNPQAYFEKLESRAYDWEDLKRLLRKDQKIDPKSLVKKCVQNYHFLGALTAEEEKILADVKRHHEAKKVHEIEKRLGSGRLKVF